MNDDIEMTYTVRVDGGRTVEMTGMQEDLHKILAAMRAVRSEPALFLTGIDYVLGTEKHWLIYHSPSDPNPFLPVDTELECCICHQFAGMGCTCPECSVCGVAGDPTCINTHMPWHKWPAFHPAPEPYDENGYLSEIAAEQAAEVSE